MRCSTSSFLGALILRGVNVETSGVFGHHYLNSATVQKPGYQIFVEILCIALIQPCALNYPLEGYRVSCFNYFISCEYHPPIKDIFILLFNVLLKQGTLFCQHNQVTKKSLHKLIQLLAKITFLQPICEHI